MSIGGISSDTDDVYGPSSTISGPTSFPFSVAYWIKTNSIQTRYHLKMLDSSDAGVDEHFIAPRSNTGASTGGYARYRLFRDGGAGADDDITIDDAYQVSSSTDDTDWTCVVLVFNLSNDVDVYIGGSLVGTDTGNEDVLAGSNGLDTLYILGEGGGAGPAENEHLAEVALWTGEALSSGNITDLQTKTADNISNNPEYYWPLKSDGAATFGGQNMTALNGASASYDATNHPSLTEAGGGSGNPHYYYAQQ